MVCDPNFSLYIAVSDAHTPYVPEQKAAFGNTFATLLSTREQKH
jgi:hypothetical protein